LAIGLVGTRGGRGGAAGARRGGYASKRSRETRRRNAACACVARGNARRFSSVAAAEARALRCERQPVCREP